MTSSRSKFLSLPDPLLAASQTCIGEAVGMQHSLACALFEEGTSCRGERRCDVVSGQPLVPRQRRDPNASGSQDCSFK